MSRKFNLFLGEAGLAFTKAEFLARGWNTAVPDVDIGDDIFVVENYQGNFYRVQVKTAKAKKTRKGHSTRYNIPISQLLENPAIRLYYVLVSRLEQQWLPPLVISQFELQRIYENHNIGSKQGNQLLLYIKHDNEKTSLTCSGQSFSKFVNNWEDFPIIPH